MRGAVAALVLAAAGPAAGATVGAATVVPHVFDDGSTLVDLAGEGLHPWGLYSGGAKHSKVGSAPDSEEGWAPAAGIVRQPGEAPLAVILPARRGPCRAVDWRPSDRCGHPARAGAGGGAAPGFGGWPGFGGGGGGGGGGGDGGTVPPPAVIPLPAAGWLIVAGVLALAGAGRRA